MFAFIPRDHQDSTQNLEVLIGFGQSFAENDGANATPLAIWENDTSLIS